MAREKLPTIVVVDDVEDVRKLVSTQLRLSKKFDVLATGSNGQEAVDLAAEHKPDLLLLDASMPVRSGISAIPDVHAVSPDTRVVMYTGFEEAELADHALAVGAADYVEKSVSIETLFERLDAALDAPADGSEARQRLTERRSRVVLDEQLESFRVAFDQATIGMATLTLTGNIVRANAELAKITGEESSGLVGRLYSDLVHPRDAAAVTDLIAAVSTSEHARRHEHTLRTVRGDVPVTATFATVRDPSGRSLYLLLQVQDVSSERQATRTLRATEEQLRLLVDAVADYAMFILDPQGNVVSWNPGAQRIKGYSADEIIGRHFSIFYPTDVVATGHPQLELEIAARDGRYEEEGWRVRKDGTEFWANVLITALRDERGELVGFAKVTRDVTERHEMQEQQARAAARLAEANQLLEEVANERTEFLAVTAHELRSPIGVVTGFAKMLRDHWNQLTVDERKDLLDRLAATSARLSRLLEDLLIASRLESGVLRMEIEPTPIEPLIASAIADYAVEGAIVSGAADVTVLADPDRLTQILGNFFNNAMKYGEPPIEVIVRTVNGSAQLRVCDSGAGVADEFVPYLFDKFAHRSSHGNGLGLFIVRELARAQGGDAWYEPAPSGGACFVVQLPAQDSDGSTS